MSNYAITFAIKQQIVTDPTARHVLLLLADSAGLNGEAAFPSRATLSNASGLSIRTVQRKLMDLQEAGLIKRGNQKIAQAYIDRQDRIPIVYDICVVPLNDQTGLPESKKTDEVTENPERGDTVTPNPVSNPDNNVNNNLGDFLSLGKQILADNNMHSRMDFSIIQQWLDAGIDPQVIRDTVRTSYTKAMASGKQINSLKYFHNAVMNVQKVANGQTSMAEEWKDI